MNAPLVVVFPSGQLTPKDKERFTKHGVLAVEADDPKSVVQLHLHSPLVVEGINGDQFITAALQAMVSQPSSNDSGGITYAGRVKSEFVALLAKHFGEQK